MANYTLTDFCQGHGAECADLDGYCEVDHGVRSYCDGTCSEARWAYRSYLETHSSEAPPPSTDTITLEVRECATSSAHIAHFEGPDAEAWALAYISARSSTHAVSELPEQPYDWATFPQLAEHLNPTCDHGLSEHNCYGPWHYPTEAQLGYL